MITKNIIRQYANLAIVIILTVIIALMSSTCCFPIEKKAKESGTNKESDKIAETVNRNLVGSNTGFALKILKELSSKSETSNVFISPISISLSAAIAYNGAKNNTANEIAEIFEFKDYDINEFNNSFKNLLLSMKDIDEMVKLYTANSIWFEKDFVIEESFTDVVEKSYSASVFNKDFKKAETANEINSWVNNATEQKITKVIDKRALSDSVMLLISAIYFKGQWKEKFKEENTKEDDFFLMDESIKKVQMMQITRDFDYYEEENFQMIRIPYGRNKTAMYIFLPGKDIGLNKFLNDLTTDLLDKYILDSYSTKVILEFPKFNIEYFVSLKSPLKSLGVSDAFMKDAADFSNIAPELFISDIEHKTIIEVNEEGTVAAAANSFSMGLVAEKPVSFIVDRPFILFIRDDRTGNILFEGKVTEP